MRLGEGNGHPEFHVTQQDMGGWVRVFLDDGIRRQIDDGKRQAIRAAREDVHTRKDGVAAALVGIGEVATHGE